MSTQVIENQKLFCDIETAIVWLLETEAEALFGDLEIIDGYDQEEHVTFHETRADVELAQNNNWFTVTV